MRLTERTEGAGGRGIIMLYTRPGTSVAHQSSVLSSDFNPRMASPCIPWANYGGIQCSVVAPTSQIRAVHVYRGGRAAVIGYLVEG